MRGKGISTFCVATLCHAGAFRTISHLIFQQPWEGGGPLGPGGSGDSQQRNNLPKAPEMVKTKLRLWVFYWNNCLGDAGGILETVQFLCFLSHPSLRKCLHHCLGLRPKSPSSSPFPTVLFTHLKSWVIHKDCSLQDQVPFAVFLAKHRQFIFRLVWEIPLASYNIFFPFLFFFFFWF